MLVKILSFHYLKPVNDKDPVVLPLHERDNLLCAINIKYLSEDQIKELMKWIAESYNPVLNQVNVTSCRIFAPDIFETAYRTYTRSFITEVEEKPLEIITPEENG